jgi:hypothetical protein
MEALITHLPSPDVTALALLALHPMPPGVHGALVHRITADPSGPLRWLPADAPPLRLGQILLLWEPATHHGMDVTARLGLATTEVLLATWPAAPDDWPHLVRHTLAEVTTLCSALAVATAALEFSNRLGPH